MRQQGMTSTDMLLALILVIILLAFLLPHTQVSSPRVRVVAARTQIKVFEVALIAFEEDNGSFPAGTNGLHELIRRPVGAKNWRGPYLDGERIPKDPWGRDFIYHYPGEHTATGHPFDLMSLGPIGATNPIVNWADLKDE
jgi:general secretion pathway protein G